MQRFCENRGGNSESMTKRRLSEVFVNENIIFFGKVNFFPDSEIF